MALLKIEGLTKRFGGLTALNGVSFSVEPEKIVSLIGPNGAGKTTLFNCMTGLLAHEGGRILFGPHQEELLTGCRPHEVAQFGISRTFQNIRLFANMTVVENVLVGTYVRTQSGILEALWPWAGAAHQERRWAVDRAMRLLERLALESYAHRLASELSLGQQRSLELARALASDPELLLLDEPAAGLALPERRALMDFLLELKKEGMTILLIEHDMQVVMPISDRVVVLDYGSKIAEGPPKAVQEDPKVIEAYLGVMENDQ